MSRYGISTSDRTGGNLDLFGVCDENFEIEKINFID